MKDVLARQHHVAAALAEADDAARGPNVRGGGGGVDEERDARVDEDDGLGGARPPLPVPPRRHRDHDQQRDGARQEEGRRRARGQPDQRPAQGFGVPCGGGEVDGEG